MAKSYIYGRVWGAEAKPVSVTQLDFAFLSLMLGILLMTDDGTDHGD